ncbi:MAG: SH3 domain-containing protein [Clostridia bacterium]|nr:SH3 domain-containing protein [Clostridia bacterium]MBR6008415.1 SH3 domain-containing protein [Clostridia bacterium]MBR6498726.1 SH3 domain-containing protein [Clostridia bacterium]
MKKIVRSVILTVLALMLAVPSFANAEILSSRGQGQIGYQAVVLCESLTMRQSASSSAKALRTLKYGDVIIVAKQTNGWAYCVLGDSENSPSGWVNADYIVVDPQWYRSDAKTTVYAWNSTSAPKVALLEKNTTLPILKVEKDWIVVSLRGAAGWIRR